MPKISIRPDGILDPEGRYPNPFTGKPYSDEYKKNAIRFDENGVNQGWTKYPTWKDRNKIFKMLNNYQIILLIAPPGTGKTVIVPKLMSHYFKYKKKIIITTPRQKTTKSAAGYAAFLLDVPSPVPNTDADNNAKNKGYKKPDDVIKYVGYKYKNATEYDKYTKLLYSTDGSIKVMMTSKDPDLKDYAGIIIDEAHERNINIDILLAFIIELCNKRPDFKVIIMSATVDPVIFMSYFKRLKILDKFAMYNPEGIPSNYKITKEFASMKNIKPDDVTNIVQEKIDNILKDNTIMDKIFSEENNTEKGKFMKYGRDILIFLSSKKNCKKIKNFIDDNYKKGFYKYKPYTIVFTKDTGGIEGEIAIKEGGLNKIEGTNDYQFKIIISTPVAESSITFEDPIAYVLEGGVAFSNKFIGEHYGTKGGTDFVADSNIAQRCGRTGRTNDGICIHIYSKNQYENIFPKFSDPNIMHDDLTSDFLGLINLPEIGNVTNCIQFLGKMIEPISNYKTNAKVCINNLLEYDCVDSSGYLTLLGKICSSFGEYDYKTVRLLIAGYNLGILNYSLFLAGILTNVKSYDDLFFEPLGADGDEELKEKYLQNVISFKHKSGDHLSLLNIYIEWFYTDKYKKHSFCQKYNLNCETLNNIKESIKTLAEAFKKNLKLIKKLRPLFKKYKKKKKDSKRIILGGGSISDNNVSRHDAQASLFADLNTHDLNLSHTINKEQNYQFYKNNNSLYGIKPGCEGRVKENNDRYSDIYFNRSNSKYAQYFSTLFGGGRQNDDNSEESDNEINNTNKETNNDNSKNKKNETNCKKQNPSLFFCSRNLMFLLYCRGQ